MEPGGISRVQVGSGGARRHQEHLCGIWRTQEGSGAAGWDLGDPGGARRIRVGPGGAERSLEDPAEVWRIQVGSGGARRALVELDGIIRSRWDLGDPGGTGRSHVMSGRSRRGWDDLCGIWQIPEPPGGSRRDLVLRGSLGSFRRCWERSPGRALGWSWDPGWNPRCNLGWIPGGSGFNPGWILTGSHSILWDPSAAAALPQPCRICSRLDPGWIWAGIWWDPGCDPGRSLWIPQLLQHCPAGWI